MRSVRRGSYERLTSLRALWRAWKRYRRGKTRRPGVAWFDLDADRWVLALRRDLRAGRYRPSPHRLRVIHDPKTRLIAAPHLRDRVVHRALLAEIGPAYERGFIEHSYSCLTGRGPHRAVLCYLARSRRYAFRLSLDVRRYFASVRHDTLVGLFARRLRDPETVALVEALVRHGGEVYRSPEAARVLGAVLEGCGMPLGAWLSHWSGALYLDGLDHFVQRELKVGPYQRYQDDMTLFGDDRDALERAAEAIAGWLAEHRRLSLKPSREGVAPAGQPSTYLGYRVSRAGLRPGRKARRRLARKLAQADRLGTDRLVRSLRSYQAHLLF